MKAIVVYDTKYGNTELVAKKITESMEANGIDTDLNDVKEVNFEKMADYDAILIGAPVHFGAASRTISKFIDKLGGLRLKGNWTAVFDTYMKTDFEKGVKQMETRLNEKVPRLKLIVPGLSIQVDGMKGPIVEGELLKCEPFGRRIAAQLKIPQVAQMTGEAGS
jgi:menaquinone-dependent protoporphyrinogen IX oxidase